MNQPKKSRVLKSWSKHNFPEHVWPEILSRCPVKSVLQFRAVSRSWKAMIDDPNFTRLHLERFNNGAEPRFFFVTGSSYECVVKKNKNLRTSLRFGYLFNDLDADSPNVLSTVPSRSTNFNKICWWSILSSIDGLFILNSQERPDLLLWNPSIRKTLILPPSPLIPPRFKNVDFGLGFDPSIGDYKCIRFISDYKTGFTCTAVYTLGTNSWDEISFRGDPRRGLRIRSGKKIIPFDGYLFALALDSFAGPMELVFFDLSREVLASIELPIKEADSDDDNWGGNDVYKTVYDQSLTIMDDINGGRSLQLITLTRPEASIWILQRLGADSSSWSWIPRCNFAIAPELDGSTWFLRFMCMTKKRNEMLWTCGNSVIRYNLETGEETRMLQKNQNTIHDGDVMPYVESLIWLRD